ncbi:MAG: D-tyrosyl-tRNA(Tyr) deacylase [Trueperaceae bacterium]|nr:D-tyrosyl-tRNA(Tyr) deacylase [Trueperaceae bacterium]
MRALIQRVSEASVTVDSKLIGQISAGLLVLLGVTDSDTETEARKLALKVAKLRIFNDDAGKMNLSVLDKAGEVLVVSQFTLYADARKGNRPSYVAAAHPDHATPLYQYFSDLLRQEGLRVANGQFGANMDVRLLNQGPVSIWLDTADF